MDLDIFILTIPLIIPIFFLYTELHYRFPIKFSRYFIKEPEILADIPHRINPNCKAPVMILIKDADKHPIFLKDINVDIYQNSQILKSNLYLINSKINNYWWYKTFFLNSKDIKGHTSIQVRINYKINGKIKTTTNHNIKILSPIPFKVYFSEYKLPGSNISQYGDIHYHSNLTDDMVEFGAPLKPTLEACQSLGLDFICNTDHSYDLDDKPGSWIETDPKLTKWNESRDEIKSLNKTFNFDPFMIPSEELSMHNSLGQNIHALILNNSKFLPGQGDSAEIPFDFSCEYNSKTLYNDLEDDALCIASHPFAPTPLLEKLFFKRGKWEKFDIIQNNMSGLQILNGDLDESFYIGIKQWINYLLNGYKKFIFAGNDAHGNFNKYRQINIPMFSIKESNKQILGICRTGVFPKIKKNIHSTIDAMKKGNCFITNGPFLNMNLNIEDINHPMGSKVSSSTGKLIINAISNIEFGKLKKYRIIKGIIGNKDEIIIKEESFINDIYDFDINLEINSKTEAYYRAEIETINYKGLCIAMTNPIWLKSI